MKVLSAFLARSQLAALTGLFLLSCSSSSSLVDAKERNSAIEVLRGGAWTFHVGGGDPCDFARTSCTFASVSALSNATAPRALRKSGGASTEDDAVVETMAAVRKPPHAVMSVSSTRINHLDPLAVSFSLQHATPGAADWIGVFCNDNEATPLPDDQYVDWRYTGGANAATLQFGPLVNMRCSWQFRYFAANGADGKANVKLGASPFVRFNRGNKEPLQVHISSTSVASEMRVMWVSAPVQAPTVFYGASPSSLTKVAVATGDSYKASDMCHAPATTVASQFYRDPGTMYAAVMKDLQPERTYYYKVGDLRSSNAQSQVFKFKTPPAPGKQTKPMSFFVYGDLGDWNIKATGPKPEQRTATTVELMRKDMDDPSNNFVATMHNGDISYAMGRTYLWDQFSAIIHPVATEIPYMVGIGNHEYCHTSGGEKDPSGAPGNGFHPPEGNYGSDSNGECGVPFNKRFIMPDNGNKVFWWSVEYGLTHHTQISSEHDFTPGAPMYMWLESDLKSVDRSKTPWLLLYLHRPMYTSEQYDSDYRLSLFIRKNLEPLLAKYKVDVVFSGHYHSYELTCPVYKEKCLSEPLALPPTTPASGSVVHGLEKAKAPVHIMVGSAGADVDNVGYFDVPWRVAAELNYGYGRFHVFNASHAQWEFVRNKDKQVTSTAWVISDHDWLITDA